jgi:hypothetical protein
LVAEAIAMAASPSSTTSKPSTNPIRAYSALRHLSPDEYEAEHHQTHAADKQAA